MERALTTALRSDEFLRTTCAGRTDAGVHARGQVAHVDVAPRLLGPVRDPEWLRQRLTGLLPPDIAVNDVAIAPPGFDARFAAVSRRYRYFVIDGRSRRDPTMRNFAWWRRERLDPTQMNEAALSLTGLRDFAAFCRAREGATTTRTLQRLECRRNGRNVLVIEVAADAFCHSMVRSLVGALVAVGAGRRPVGWLRELQLNGERSSAVQVAPARGLFLEGVDYPHPVDYGLQADRARARRDTEPGLL